MSSASLTCPSWEEGHRGLQTSIFQISVLGENVHLKKRPRRMDLSWVVGVLTEQAVSEAASLSARLWWDLSCWRNHAGSEPE